MSEIYGAYSVDARKHRIDDAYAAMVAQQSPGPVLATVMGVIPDLLAAATAQVDQELAQEGAAATEIILASELADDALAVFAWVARGQEDHERAIRLEDLRRRFDEHRRQMLLSLIKASGQDLCRECLQLRPADEIQLVLTDTCYLKSEGKGHKVVTEVYYGYLCAACRTDKPRVSQDFMRPDGTTEETVETYRTICEAAEAGGMFWVLVDADYQSTYGESNVQPDSKRACEIVLTNPLAEQFGVPPAITVHGTLGSDARVVIQSSLGTLPFIFPAAAAA